MIGLDVGFILMILETMNLFRLSVLLYLFGVVTFRTEVGLAGTDVSSQPSMPLRILWTVSQYIENPESQMSFDQIRSYLGKPLDMGESHISFAGKSCEGITIARTPAETQTFLAENFQITAENVAYYNDHLTVFTTDCHLQGFKVFARLRDRRIIVMIQGVVFLLAPNVNY